MNGKDNDTRYTHKNLIGDILTKRLIKKEVNQTTKNDQKEDIRSGAMPLRSGLNNLLDELNCFKQLAIKFETLINGRTDQVIQLHERDGITFVKTKNIVRFEAKGAYTKVFMQNNEVLISRHLKFFEEQITADFFCRVHQSHFINLLYVRRYLNLDGGQILMVDQSLIPISKAKRRHFFDKINTYNFNS